MKIEHCSVFLLYIFKISFALTRKQNNELFSKNIYIEKADLKSENGSVVITDLSYMTEATV